MLTWVIFIPAVMIFKVFVAALKRWGGGKETNEVDTFFVEKKEFITN